MNKQIKIILDFLNEIELPDEVKKAKEIIEEANNDTKPILTETGKIILDFMKMDEDNKYKSSEIAEGLGLSTRKISGAMTKLANDGFLEKYGKNPVIYTLTDMGKNFKIEEKGE